jgi:hypothetical protein
MDVTFNQPFAAQGLDVVALDADAEDIANFPVVVDYAQWLGPPNYPVGIETSLNYATFASSFEGSNPFPIDVLVGKDGTIRYIAREYDPTELLNMIPDLLAE